MKPHHPIVAALSLLAWSGDLPAAPSGSDFFDKWPEQANPRATGNMHGQAPVLWCASALLR